MAGAPEVPPKRRDEPPPLEFFRPGETPSQPPPEQPAAWVTTPEDFERAAKTRAAGAPRRPGRALAAGIFLLLAGLISVGTTFEILVTEATPAELDQVKNWTAADYRANALLLLFLVYPAPVAFLGGIMALQRRNWKLAVGCAFVSLLTIGFLFLGTFLGLLGLILILTSRQEFSS